MKHRLGAGTLRRILNLWPPFLCNGIRVTDLTADWRQARVELRSRPWNRTRACQRYWDRPRRA